MYLLYSQFVVFNFTNISSFVSCLLWLGVRCIYASDCHILSLHLLSLLGGDKKFVAVVDLVFTLKLREVTALISISDWIVQVQSGSRA